MNVSRSGAALILALIVLTALLLLGLPFALSQSYSVSGSMSFRSANAANVGRDTAESLGLAAASEGFNLAYPIDTGQPQPVASSLDVDMGDALNVSGQAPVIFWYEQEPSWSQLRPRNLALTHSLNTYAQQETLEDRVKVRLASAIQDHGGRIDPNDLDPIGWMQLFKAVGIIDWDDDKVADSHNPNSDIANPITDDGNSWWELCEALARHRFSTSVGTSDNNFRYTNLDQLLDANPGHNDQDPVSPPGTSWGFRRNLTKAELEKLKPHLSLYGLGQGRRGLLDLGTVITLDAGEDNSPAIPSPVLDSNTASLLHAGQVLHYLTGSSSTTNGAYRINSGNDESWVRPTFTQPSRHHRGVAAIVGDGTIDLDSNDKIFLESPVSINLNTATAEVVAAVVDQASLSGSWPETLFGSDRPYPFTSYTDLLFSEGAPAIPASGTNPAIPAVAPTVVDSVYLDNTNPVHSGRYRPPFNIKSAGIVRIRGSATARDAAGNPIATSSRTTIAQTLPQNRAVTMQWDSQDQFEQAVRLNWSSNMVSFPHAMERISSVAPGEAGAGTDFNQDLRARPLVNWTTHDNGNIIDIDWSRPMAPTQGEQPDIDNVADLLSTDHDGTTGTAPTSGTYTAYPGGVDHPDDIIVDTGFLTPHGISIGYNDPLSYPLPSTATDTSTPFLVEDNNRETIPDPSSTVTPPPQIEISHYNEVSGSHVSLVVTPQGDWTSGTYPIIEMRAQDDSVLPQINGTLGDPQYQNLWRLEYDADSSYLVLTLANPAIEHTSDASHASLFGSSLEVPYVDRTDATIEWDERSLGGADAGPNLTVGPLAPAHPEYGRQTRHYYKIDPGFMEGQAYQIQILVAHDRPGGQKILVNGFAGRDVLQDETINAGDAVLHGDHITLPSMRLGTVLDTYPVNPTTTGAGNTYGTPLRAGDITLNLTPIHQELGIDVTDMLPERGTVLLNNEVIEYQGTTASSILDCYRGARTDTFASDHTNTADPNRPDADQVWPVLEVHSLNDMVIPAGVRYRVEPINNVDCSLLVGEATLSMTLHNGDPTLGPRYGYIWTQVDSADVPIISTATTTEIISNGLGTPTQFPDRGIIIIGGLFAFHYNGFNAGTFEDCTPVDVLGINSSSSPFTYDLTLNPPGTLDIWLASIEVDSELINNSGGVRRFEDSSWRSMIQIEHPSTGRIEWLDYDDIFVDPSISGAAGYGYFVSTLGFGPNDRGRERTVFALDLPSLFPDPIDSRAIFPAGSRILPVQTGGWYDWTNGNHWSSSSTRKSQRLVTGDVLTLIPSQPNVSTTDRTPKQMVVRYAATDGHPTTDPLAGPPTFSDTSNQYYAFTEPIGESYHATLQEGNYELTTSLAWSGRDLTPLNPVTIIPGYMPRIDGMGASYQMDGDARVYFGGNDNRNASANLSDVEVIIDNLLTAQLNGETVGSLDFAEIEEITNLDGTPGTILTSGTLGQTIEVDVPGFFGGINHQYGLLSIDGEVVAYEKLSNSEAILIARGLLGTSHQDHQLTTTPNITGTTFTITRGPSVIRLPMGPIRRLGNQTAGGTTGSTGLPTNAGGVNAAISIDLSSGNPAGFDYAPCYLVMASDGTAFEYLHLIKQNGQYFTAPWLRNLYGGDNNAAFVEGDLVMAWYPRFASALPPSPVEQHYRCRQYTWAGFPVRFYDTFFESGDVALNFNTTHFNAEARYLSSADTNFDWTTNLPTPISNTSTASSIYKNPIDTLFPPPLEAVDGGELRLIWTYQNLASGSLNQQYSTLSQRMGMTPQIDFVDLDVYAPTLILGREGSQ